MFKNWLTGVDKIYKALPLIPNDGNLYWELDNYMVIFKEKVPLEYGGYYAMRFTLYNGWWVPIKHPWDTWY